PYATLLRRGLCPRRSPDRRARSRRSRSASRPAVDVTESGQATLFPPCEGASGIHSACKDSSRPDGGVWLRSVISAPLVGQAGRCRRVALRPLRCFPWIETSPPSAASSAVHHVFNLRDAVPGQG